MIKGKLNINERRVLYGMIRYPLFNDRELADKLDLKMTTVTAIKNRLKKNKYYSTVRVPILQYFGTELFTVLFVQFSPTISEKDFLEKLRPMQDQFSNFFWGGFEGGNGFGLGFARNYSDFLSTIEELSKGMREKGYVENIEPPKNQLVIFPLRNSIIYNFFDFGPILSREFDITFGDEEQDIVTTIPKQKNVRLTTIEKRVLYGLVNYPELPDSKISAKINVTRQVISKLKKSFEDDGLIKTIKVPNLKILGYEILVMGHNFHNPLTPISKRIKGITMVKKEMPIIFQISSNLESFVISPMKNFQEFQEMKNKAMKLYKQEKYFIQEPRIHLYSIDNFNFVRNHEYGAIVKKVLDIQDV